MHLCISKVTILGSDNGLSSGWCQAINWTNDGILLILPIRTMKYQSKFIYLHSRKIANVIWEMSAILSHCVNYPAEVMHGSSWHIWGGGGRFKNTYELLNLRALELSSVNKIHIFQCMYKIFCVEFQREPLKFHTKYLKHTLNNTIFIQSWNFKSS